MPYLAASPAGIGDLARVLRLSSQLLNHFWTTQGEDRAQAVELLEEPSQLQVLGPDHTDALVVRTNIRSLTAELVDVRKSLDLFERLLSDQVRAHGHDHGREPVTNCTTIHDAAGRNCGIMGVSPAIIMS